QTKMGSTWRFGSEGRLPAEAWSEAGYSPRRRSIAYLIGECLLKANYADKAAGTPGPYRAEYLRAKADFQARHPDYSALRCHRHGMLLAVKLLLLNLRREWRRVGE